MKIHATHIVTTLDGSHTLYVPEMQEHYHSVYGAVNESMHIFINAGFHACGQNPLHILEIGFGTGLNAFLTCLEAEKMNREILYHAVELFPLNEQVIAELNYPHLPDIGNEETFHNLHRSPWNEPVEVKPGFVLKKIHADFTECDFDMKYHLVYFDAFAPDKQPEMWTSENFRKLCLALDTGGILVTYSSKGTVKNALREAGFNVMKIPGPEGKREMVRARKES